MRKHFIFYLFTVLILLLSFNSNGQIISGNAFLQGNYIRLGMTENAAFGSGVNGPPGLLPIGADVRNTPVCNLGKLGFAADVGKDGWTVGTPAFIGDYFLPGTPEEGWSVSLNGLHYNNNRSPLYIPGFSDQCVGGTQINGAFINFVDLPDKQVATWDGLVNGLRIVKTITLPKNKLYFIIEIKMYNTTSSTISDVYYMRNVDPDNEVAQVGSGGYPTNNTIEFQNPSSSNKALVSARGQSYNSYLGLGSIDCRARVCIRGGALTGTLANRNAIEVHNGTPPRLSTLGANAVQDAAIAIAFQLGNIAAGDSVRCAFAYILLQQDLEEALNKTAPQFEVNGQLIPSGGGIVNCSNTTIPINIVNGVDYNWTWSPATGLNTTTGTSVIHSSQPNPVNYTVTGIDPICGPINLSFTVYPGAQPLALFDATTPCGSKTVSFTNRSLVVNDTLATYTWDFGDGQSSTQISPSHTYANFGTYTVKLSVVTSTVGCLNDTTFTRVINVLDGAAASIIYSNDACAGRPVNLSGSVNLPPNSISNHVWTLPGGITYTTSSITHTFNTPGEYDVSYTASSTAGCITAGTKRIVVESFPRVSFIAADGCVGMPVNFTSNSTNDSGAVRNYNWSFGNGQTSTQQNPTNVFTNAGNQTVQFSASTANGCSGTVGNIINIEAIPVADFIYANACPGVPVLFTNRSSTSYGTIGSYVWDFDNGSTSTLTSPTTTFIQDRQYRVTLKATSVNGCESPLKTIVVPIKSPVADAGNDTLVFKDAPFILKANGGLMYSWTPASLLDNANKRFPVAKINSDQVFTVEIADERGCRASDQVKISVFVDDDIYVPTMFTPNADGKNDIFRPIAPPNVIHVFEVYNRWGQKIFITNDPQKGWNGKLNGETQPTGVYVWYLKATTRKGVYIEKKGTVTLVR